MNIPFFDLKRQNERLKGEVSIALDAVLKKGEFILGEFVSTFENKFCEYQGLDHFISCANGTDALEIAMIAVGIAPGDEVLVPSFGWLSPYLATKNIGAVPVIVDVKKENYGLDPSLIQSKISSKTKAVMIMHLFGLAADVEPIKEICEAYDLILIEDCAQAQGVFTQNGMLGTFGDLSTFSFYPTKNLGAYGDGGGVATKNADLAIKLKAIRNYGRESDGKLWSARNSRLDELQAAVLLVKMKYLDEWNARRQMIALKYLEILGLSTNQSNFHQAVICVSNRRDFQEYLKSKGIETAIHYPFDIGSYFKVNTVTPVAEKLAQQVVSLPIYPELTDEEILYICHHLKNLKGYIL